jgi:hypothetical protein
MLEAFRRWLEEKRSVRYDAASRNPCATTAPMGAELVSVTR